MTFSQGWDGPKVYAAQLGEPVRLDLTMPPPQVGIVPLRPLGVGDVLSGAFKAVRFNPAVMFGLTVLVVLLGQLLGTGATLLLGEQLGASLVPYEEPGLSIFGDVPTMLVQFGTGELTGLVVNMALMYATAQAVLARRVRPADALRHLGRRLLPALGLAGLLGGVGLLAVGAVALVFGAAGSSQDPSAVIGLGFLLLLLAGPLAAWLSIRLSFAACVVAVEEVGPIRALRRSWAVTRGLFWRVLGITLLVNLVVGMAAGTVSQVFTFGAMLLALESEAQFMLVAVTASTVVASVLTLPLTSAATTLLYVDCRIRREGFDIALSEAMYG
ncbi:MAG: glycerophosphoryl diester phosphodiesterase membrane domain-containing protein [Propionicimonas sp.]|nr:glycerophosphoryl diester phosphodiesterase membrane domain-containing protein [Propionicimonas sp.]